MRILKPRFLKSKAPKIHVGKPLVMRGWKMPCKWTLIARRGFGEAYQKMTLVRRSLDEARETVQELFLKGWDSVEVKEQELLTPLRKA